VYHIDLALAVHFQLVVENTWVLLNGWFVAGVFDECLARE